MDQPPRRLAVLAPLLLATALLAGCGRAVPPLLPADHPERVAAERIGYQPGVSPIYCYRTLASADCYSVPQEGPPNRLINAYPDRTRE